MEGIDFSMKSHADEKILAVRSAFFPNPYVSV